MPNNNEMNLTTSETTKIIPMPTAQETNPAAEPLTEEQLGEIVQNFFDPDADEKILNEMMSSDEPEGEPVKKFTWETKRISAKTAIEAYCNGKIILPKCQRLYVWTDKQKEDLLETIKQGAPFGDITIGQVEGNDYLGDGYQRLTTLMFLADDENLTAEEKKDVLQYKFNLVTVKDMNWADFNNYFRKRNGGTPLASVVKERARLEDPLSQAILDISSDPYFRDGAFKSTFVKNQQQEIVAMTSLLAAAGLKTEIKAKKLADALTAAKDLVLEHTKEAQAIVEKIVGGFRLISSPVIVKRAFTANYLSALIYLVHKGPTVTETDIFNCTVTIFASTNALPEYRSTVRSNAASISALDNRISVLETVVIQCREEDTYAGQEAERLDD